MEKKWYEALEDFMLDHKLVNGEIWPKIYRYNNRVTGWDIEAGTVVYKWREDRKK